MPDEGYIVKLVLVRIQRAVDDWGCEIDQGKALLSFSGAWVFFFKCTGGDLRVMLPQ